jgi:thiol-disulfide isomerase/thioredoxin
MTELVSKDLNGKAVKLSDYKGKVVVLDIWATWCGPCRDMIPHEREMAEKFKGKPFALIGLNADEDVETLKGFLQKEKMPWIHWHIGAEGNVYDQLNIEHYPTIFVLDSKGKIRFKEVRGEDLERAVATLLKEAEVR